ncbi:PIN domain-containing protein [Methanoregula sp.]|jgi:predicted nucleic acid-binding protein|uniref:type II toxin-antitoxin system VapC family toxin n=1 Tax=Methanoregula sp. TaxID=2052170 RepID=UPI0034410B16
MYLIDTNIFLEILLNDSKRTQCEIFLNNNIGSLHITDFSLHSIGVVLYNKHKIGLYARFIKDVMPSVQIETIPIDYHFLIDNGHITYHFDFDDAYQYGAAKYHGLILKTLDHHFDTVTDISVETI